MFIAILTLLTLAGLGVESYILSQTRSKVATRIHINGTRGKSTTVRLIAAMCRAAGRITVAKFTGGRPGFIDPAGIQSEWKRHGHARLAEQLRFWRKAAASGAEVAVLECMAVDPYLQWVAERSITKATHTVITNVRPDHYEVMGHSQDEVARSLANTIPVDGQLILGDETYMSLYAQAAQERGSSIIAATESDRQALWEKLGKDCGWTRAFLENATTALLTASSLGVPQSVAESVLRAWPQPKPFYRVMWENIPVNVINALSANDPVSAAAAWDLLPAGVQGVALYAHRGDRPLRLKAFLHALAPEQRCSEIMIAGPIARRHVFLRDWLRNDGSGRPRIGAIGTPSVVTRLTNLVRQGSRPIWLILLGNELGIPSCLQVLTEPDEQCDGLDSDEWTGVPSGYLESNAPDSRHETSGLSQAGGKQ